MAGTFHGRDRIFRFLATLPKETDGTYASRLIDVLASDDRAAALYRASGRRNGRTLDLEQVLLFTIADGLVTEVLALPSDPTAFDAFWAREG
jgi:ketosteroid isomerase-like protein